MIEQFQVFSVAVIYRLTGNQKARIYLAKKFLKGDETVRMLAGIALRIERNE